MQKSQIKLKGTEDMMGEGEELSGETPQSHHSEVAYVSPRPPERRLHPEEVGVRLSLLGKTSDGDSYAYLKVTCTDMQLTNISAIATFHHLLFVNVSNNLLSLEDLQVLTTMPYLVLVHADNNHIKSVALKRSSYLQVVIMNHNQITSCQDFFQPQATTLELGYNNITEAEFQYTKHMPGMKCLDLRYNMIEHIKGIQFTNLQSLYLAGNKIKSLAGIELLLNLKILHFRNNPIKKLDCFTPELKKLSYVNFRNCKIDSLRQVKKMKVLKGLKVVILKGTPYMGGTGGEEQEDADAEDDPEQRTEILAAMPTLQRINKGVVTPEDREEANELLKQWIEEQADKEEEEEEEEEAAEELQQE